MHGWGTDLVYLSPTLRLAKNGAPVAEFANRLIGADGQTIVLDDIRVIVDDPSLSDDQKRTRLRELGIADETLISALLTL